METYLGHTIKYWVELQKRAEELELVKPLSEIAELRARVSFYESRIKEMAAFKEEADKITTMLCR